MITQEQLKSCLEYDHENGCFYRKKGITGGFLEGDKAGCAHGSGYIHIRVMGKSYTAHRLAWLYIYGEMPECEIDHINCNKSDNRISNLRLSDRKGNVCNVGLRKDNKSGVKGVSWHREASKWVAHIKNDGKKIYLGLFSDLEDAANAVSAARANLHKDFARDNYEVKND